MIEIKLGLVQRIEVMVKPTCLSTTQAIVEQGYASGAYFEADSSNTNLF